MRNIVRLRDFVLVCAVWLAAAWELANKNQWIKMDFLNFACPSLGSWTVT